MELDDKKNLKLIKQALKDYEDGALVEARDALAEVVHAIDNLITADMIAE